MAAVILHVDVDYVVREHLAGKSVLDLSREMGVSRPTIVRRLRDAGVTPRSGGDAQRLVWARRLDPEERRKQVAAAHAAVRGRPQPMERKIAGASTREVLQLGISPLESRLVGFLRERGLAVAQQKAIGPYSCDIAASPVAVEVFGGQWHFSGRHARRAPMRIRYLMDRGWDVLMVLVTKAWPLTAATADHVIAYVERRRREPAATREYRMIRSTGELLVRGSAEDEKIALVLPYRRGQNPRSHRNQLITG